MLHTAHLQKLRDPKLIWRDIIFYFDKQSS